MSGLGKMTYDGVFFYDFMIEGRDKDEVERN